MSTGQWLLVVVGASLLSGIVGVRLGSWVERWLSRIEAKLDEQEKEPDHA